MIMISVLPSLCALYAAFGYALGTSVYTPVSQRYSWAAISVLRAGFALPLFLVWALVLEFSGTGSAGGFADLTWKSVAWLAVASIGTQGCADGLLLLASRRIGVPTTLTIAGIYPLWTALWLLIQGGSLTWFQGAGLLMVLTGVAALIYLSEAQATHEEKPGRALLSVGSLVGIAIALLASMLFALAIFGIRNGGSDVNIGVANTVRMSLGLLIAPSLAMISGIRRERIIMPVKEMKSLVWILSLETVGFAAYVYAMTKGSLVTVSALSSLSPVFAVVIALCLGREMFSFKKMFFVMLTCAGVILLN
jgi:drug/metabolite transporter (DMT)-like permease